MKYEKFQIVKIIWIALNNLNKQICIYENKNESGLKTIMKINYCYFCEKELKQLTSNMCNECLNELKKEIYGTYNIR